MKRQYLVLVWLQYLQDHKKTTTDLEKSRRDKHVFRCYRQDQLPHTGNIFSAQCFHGSASHKFLTFLTQVELFYVKWLIK